MVLACNPKYMRKLTEEEKLRALQLRASLAPGRVLEFTQADYHEDDETPPGFHVPGDRLELVSVVRKEPIKDPKTLRIVGTYDVWLCKSSRWSDKDWVGERDANYLAWMTKVVEKP
jgi:hypothetical protein